ncbi:S-layer homology domain-containing protein [Okeania sp.]|uniref:S-layer homology domain-containing protein n=1 Tax=Okeania sp. TaxID=3100323 RepID=UPI002B4B89E9|nr:S-layer homology domain-containing protein [Okeania sp.]MEB3339853.1 S-layer homology domain-containing protein [Okeania sp.]
MADIKSGSIGVKTVWFMWGVWEDIVMVEDETFFSTELSGFDIMDISFKILSKFIFMSMLLNKPEIFASLTICLLISVSSCANNSGNKDLEQILAADPQLKNNSNFNQLNQTSNQNNQQPEKNVQLPTNSPTEISPTSNSELIDKPTDFSSETSANSTLSPTPQPETQSSPNVTETSQESSSPTIQTPFPTDSMPPTSTTIPSEVPVSTTALMDVPTGLRPYIVDLSKLGIFQQEQRENQNNPNTTTAFIQPQNLVSRRVYARWLVTANNKMFANNPAKHIRLATANEKPIFEDVPKTDPDFLVIQGLAEAGLIPSPLSGDVNVVKFRPNDFLTREDLILWKVPLDFRKPLSEATIQKVKTAWDFQDASKIDPSALKAVLADSENEFSNIRRVFGYTKLFRPDKTVSRAEAAATLWYFGDQNDGISAQMALEAKQEPEKLVNPVSP